MRATFSTLLLLATTVLEAAGQGGGWYVVNESLICTATCDAFSGCNFLGGAPDDATIAKFCKQITDDCADGVLSNGQRYFGYGGTGALGTANFGTGSSNGNNGCPNNNDCNISVKYLAGNMRYPSAPGSPNSYCSAATIVVNGHYNHLKTGSLIVILPVIRSQPPKLA